MWNENKQSKLQERLIHSFTKEDAFTLPQVLILLVGISIGLTGLMTVALNNLSNSRIRTLEMQAINAAESGITSLRALLNNSRGRVYYYFWLAKACAVNSNKKECPDFVGDSSDINKGDKSIKGLFDDPSKLYWVNDSATWCSEVEYQTNANECIGRQLAPKCSYSTQQIDWDNYRDNLSFIIDSKEDFLGNTANKQRQNHYQSYSVKSINFIGNEQGGQSSIFIEGFAKEGENLNITTAANKLRVSINVEKSVPQSGFAFLSAGENEADQNSLYLGNFNVFGSNPLGSIVWRKNIYRSDECFSLKSKLGLQSLSQLPDHTRNKGGLWVQPLLLPPRPEYPKPRPPDWSGLWNEPWSLGQISCTPSNSKNIKIYTGTNCNFLATQGWYGRQKNDREATIDDLIVKGEGATFDVITTDESKVTLNVRGSIDISNGGRFCHREGSINAKCGSGKPQNLTILFEQPGQNSLSPIGTLKGRQEIECSSNGGMRLKSNNTDFGLQNIPFNTFLLSNTGNNKSELFSAFIYAPDTTLSSSSPDVFYYQKPKAGKKLLVTARGLHAYLNDPEGKSSQDRAPRFLRNYNNKFIPFLSNSREEDNQLIFDGVNGYYLLAIGERSSYSDPGRDAMLNVGLVWNPSVNKPFGNYRLIGIDINQNIAKFVDKDIDGREWNIDLGQSPFANAPSGKEWLSYYGIELVRTNNDNPMYVKGAAWMKNICFDKNKNVNWEFDKNFGESLVNRFEDKSYMYGVPYYRGKFVTTWDRLRDFEGDY